MVIREEGPADIDAISLVHRSAFPTSAEASLVSAMRTAGNLKLSLVALDEASGQLVGHIAFSPVTISQAEIPVGVGLAPVAVMPAFQRKGIGRQLIEAGLLACEQTHADFVVVLGDPGYYSIFGFQPATNYGVSNEYGVGDEFMLTEFNAGCLRAGTAEYCQQFKDMDE